MYIYIFIFGIVLSRIFCTQSDVIFKQIHFTRSGTNTPGKSGLGSNGNEGVLHTLQTSRTGVLLSVAIQCHIQDTSFLGNDGGGRTYHYAEDTITVFQVRRTWQIILVWEISDEIWIEYSRLVPYHPSGQFSVRIFFLSRKTCYRRSSALFDLIYGSWYEGNNV